MSKTQVQTFDGESRLSRALLLSSNKSQENDHVIATRTIPKMQIWSISTLALPHPTHHPSSKNSVFIMTSATNSSSERYLLTTRLLHLSATCPHTTTAVLQACHVRLRRTHYDPHLTSRPSRPRHLYHRLIDRRFHIHSRSMQPEVNKANGEHSTRRQQQSTNEVLSTDPKTIMYRTQNQESRGQGT